MANQSSSFAPTAPYSEEMLYSVAQPLQQQGIIIFFGLAASAAAFYLYRRNQSTGRDARVRRALDWRGVDDIQDVSERVQPLARELVKPLLLAGLGYLHEAAQQRLQEARRQVKRL